MRERRCRYSRASCKGLRAVAIGAQSEGRFPKFTVRDQRSEQCCRRSRAVRFPEYRSTARSPNDVKLPSTIAGAGSSIAVPCAETPRRMSLTFPENRTPGIGGDRTARAIARSSNPLGLWKGNAGVRAGWTAARLESPPHDYSFWNLPKGAAFRSLFVGEICFQGEI